MQRICSTVQRLGYDVLLVGRQKPDSVELRPRSFRQHRIRCWFNKGALFYAEYNVRLFFFLLSAKCNVISAVDADTLLACALATGPGKKLVFDAHEYFTEVPELSGRNAIKRIWQHVLDYGVKKASACYTVGPGLASLFSLQYGKKFEVVYNMPERKMVTENNKPYPVVLYQGDLNEGRGLPETMEAIKEINAELWIAGDGLMMQQLKQLAKQHGIDTRVKFLGKIAPEELHRVTMQATLGINLLDAVSLSYQYSVANKFFDYVQAYVPVVCSGFVEYRRLNEQYEVAVLCDYEPLAIRTAIKSLLTNPQHYQKLADNCKLAAAHWHWQTQENTLARIYSDII